MTSLKSLEDFLPTELLKNLEALAVEEGRDAEAVVAAAVRRYLWDSTFRKLRRHAQARSRVQGWVSDQSILTTVLALRRPDEFTLTKTEGNLDVVAGEGAEAGVGGATRSSSQGRTREPREIRGPRERRERREPRESPRPFREVRERPMEMETTRRFERSALGPAEDEAAVSEDREERGGRRPRRRGKISRREDVAVARVSSSPDELEPGMTTESRIPPPSYAVTTPSVDLAAMRRRAESMHRFLPLDPSEREPRAETHESPEEAGSHESAPREAAQPAPRGNAEFETDSGAANAPDARPSRSSPSWSPRDPSSSVSANDSPDSRPDSPAAPSPTSSPSTTTAGASFGRKPKRSGRR